MSVTRRLFLDHLVEGEPFPGREVAIRIDQTLTQDATGTLVMLSLEAMGLDRVRTQVSAQYVDHNILQADSRNADDHRFLWSACRRFGLWYSRPGNGVSHPLHQERFGRPGATLLGSDSHTCAAGAIGMLAIGAGGLEVALAMAGEPFHLRYPAVWGVRLEGSLPPWVGAKDVILEMLRRHGVRGGIGRVIEYHGPGVATLSVMDRHVIANMGAELGATTSVFPSDEVTKAYLRALGREREWIGIGNPDGAGYDLQERIDLSTLEPLIAMPSSPDRVVKVREVAGIEIGQAYVGSSANPGYRDFAVVAEMVKGRRVPAGISLDVNPTSRQIQATLMRDGHLQALLAAGARIHQAGCNGCIGMGQAPATRTYSLRTVPRNFPGRSGDREDKVCLVSPETAAASALTGRITDPRDLGIPHPVVAEPENPLVDPGLLEPPPSPAEGPVALIKGPNITSLPVLDPLPETLEIPVLLKVGDDLSTDEILPATARVLPFRSNVPKIAEFSFDAVDPTYVGRARASTGNGHAVVGGRNYGQGSSREHAALGPRFLGLRVVLARGFARIHEQNLANYGVLPLRFADPADLERIEVGDTLRLEGIGTRLRAGGGIVVRNVTKGEEIEATHRLSPRQVGMVLAGSLLNVIAARLRTLEVRPPAPPAP